MIIARSNYLHCDLYLTKSSLLIFQDFVDKIVYDMDPENAVPEK